MIKQVIFSSKTDHDYAAQSARKRSTSTPVRIQENADYCRSDVVNTYRLWLRYELFRGRLDQNQFEFSERDVVRVS